MNPYKLALAASTALVASSSLSFATVIADADSALSYNSTTNWGTSTSNTSFLPTDTFNFAGFNSSLGTLTGVVITASESVGGTITATNTGNGNANFTAALQNTFKFSIPTVSTVTLSVNSTPVTDTDLATNSSYGPVSVTEASPHRSAQTTITLSSNLSAFESAWSVTGGDLGSVTSTQYNGNTTFSSVDTGGIILTAQYTYTPTVTTPTPEPATMAVLGTGLAGMGLLRRRRKSN